MTNACVVKSFHSRFNQIFYKRSPPIIKWLTVIVTQSYLVETDIGGKGKGTFLVEMDVSGKREDPLFVETGIVILYNL